MSSTVTIAELLDLPLAERRETLEQALVPQFRRVLLMTEDDELPFDHSFFDLGMTSLALTDLKQRIEGELGCEIDANVLFNQPTLDTLLTYLVDMTTRIQGDH